jgi:inosose dehydratase
MTSTDPRDKAAHEASPKTKLAINPLGWYMTVDGYREDVAPPLPDIYRQVREAGFDAVTVQPAGSMALGEYEALLSRSGLAPAPGYFQAPFSVAADLPVAVEQAHKAAKWHSDLGLDRLFIADQLGDPVRLAAPAQGAGHDASRLAVVVENLRAVAEAMVEEGVVPCLHQHVATLVETPDEVDRVLEGIGPELLLLGPDTGHLAWAGADVPSYIRRHGDRVGAVHLKDLHIPIAEAGRKAGEGYWEISGRHLWTEPGRGDLVFSDVLDALANFEGWFVIEVDLPDRLTPIDSAKVSRQWCERYLQDRPLVAPGPR